MKFEVEWSVIPDGTSSIVQVEIRSEFAVPTDMAATLAERGVLELMARISGRPISELQSEVEAAKWVGEFVRPEEPPA